MAWLQGGYRAVHNVHSVHSVHSTIHPIPLSNHHANLVEGMSTTSTLSTASTHTIHPIPLSNHHSNLVEGLSTTSTLSTASTHTHHPIPLKAKKAGLAFCNANPAFLKIPGDELLSRGLSPKYHRRCGA
jgi:hypothetical protein